MNLPNNPKPEQPNNPLHGIKLADVLETLVKHHESTINLKYNINTLQNTGCDPV